MKPTTTTRRRFLAATIALPFAINSARSLDSPAPRVRTAGPPPQRRVGTHADVKIVAQPDGAFRLDRDRTPYFIKGAGCWSHFSALGSAGGNSVRTWGDPHRDPEVFDLAWEHDLTVLAGLWLPHSTEAFDYSNRRRVGRLINRLQDYVERHKDNPAIIMWGVGNEMEGPGTDPHIWRTVEEVCRMIHAVDPRHPTLTALAEVSPPKIAGLKRYCPSIDALGINSYGSVLTLPQRLAKLGWTGPYIVTEFGPPGPWGQVPTTAWHAPIEPTSTEKARFYYKAYHTAIETQRRQCLGSYVYFWGIESTIVATPTWYDMFLRISGGRTLRLGAVDAMTFAWSHARPACQAPIIESLTSNAREARVAPGSAHYASVRARDADHDALHAHWEVRLESPALTGPPPPIIPGCIKGTDRLTAHFLAPDKPGAYRLFVALYDRSGNAATANFPFLVERNSA